MSSDIEKAKDQRKDEPSGVPAVAMAGRTSARRGFLLGAGAAAGVAGAAAIALKTPQVAAREVAEPVAQQESEQGRGYHLTAHVRKYYDTTKV